MKVGTTRLPGLLTHEHVFKVPLDHSQPNGETIEVFVREVVDPAKEDAKQPYLLFLQGGPGGASPRPTHRSGWISRAIKDYRVLLLDQRGVASSTPIFAQTLEKFPTDEAKAEYLSRFRADSIVADCELIRQEFGAEKWSLLGQSYGGWCITRYLSAAPESIKEAFYFGGLPSVTADAGTVYRHTYPRVAERNRRYYKRFPQDVERIRAVADWLNENDVRLPQGDPLTVRKMQQVGIGFGMTEGLANTHYLFENAFVEGAGGREISDAFLQSFDRTLGYNMGPIFSILHEAIYCQGSASNWAAHRVREDFPEFDSDTGPVYFTGEMIYPWMFDEYSRLQPLKGAAEILAAKSDWSALYDLDRLKQNEVPCAAAVYYDDMYVDCELSMQTARTIPGIRCWVTNEYEHNGLRADGERILDRLIQMVNNDVDYFDGTE